MKKIILSLILVALVHPTAMSQTEKRKKRDRSNSTVIDSTQWKKDHYVINRDSAYADPRVGLQKLIGGNRRFVEGKSIKPRQDATTIKKLENGQAPFATIVGCSDSRVPNEVIFDQGLGDLFIIRTAGQVSAAASYGSMEFATLKLKTKLIVVLGHTECGAINSAKKSVKDGNITGLLNRIKPAITKATHQDYQSRLADDIPTPPPLA